MRLAAWACSLLVTILTACAPAGLPPSARPVNGTEMLALLRGNTSEGPNNLGSMLRIYVAEDLSARLAIAPAAGLPLRFDGRVWADGDRLCWAWPRAGVRVGLCYHLHVEGDRFWAVADRHQYGGLTFPNTFRILPGNPYNI